MPTHRPLLLVVVTVLLGTALAGCLGGNSAEPHGPGDGDDNGARPTDSTGSIQGRLLNDGLDPIANGRVVVAKDGEVAADKRTDSQGRYTINDLEPGDYRMQFSATCCQEKLQPVRVVAGEVVTVDVEMRVFTAADLAEPYIEAREWHGFLPCGAGLVLVTVNPCALDPNNDNVHQWQLPAGVTEVVVSVEWQSVGGVFGERLFIAMENEGCDALECDMEYARVSGGAPIVFKVTSPEGEWAFENVQDSRDLQFRIFADFEPDVYWQQPFAVYWHLFFNQKAPEGYNPSPDA